ncbi:hypothetical protein UCRPC4_g05556 [Phaeomoniella chlamydospora]|uniref:Integral membrane protein n=1 Tax=Phaeomoniella chlamydospora TaxID=158046 RepID=A0A0G2E3W7_PHACM|nr:hypothetical protein UCRPC4_g05556 [Phaeomoniella chlamydospora]
MDLSLEERSLTKRLVTKPTDRDGLILEAWAQGFMVGALIIMSCITAANMRAGVLLHKLILVELLFGIWHGFFIFNHAPVYGWYLSVSAIFLNISWSLHNVIAWMKNKPFLSRRVSQIYILSVAAVQPYWVIEIYANFAYFNNINSLFVHTRPFEALFRDPWWIFTTISLFYNIKIRYDMTLKDILRISPRFAIMLLAMILSICFLITDICSVTGAFNSSLPIGINPFWKLSFVFKCLTDSVILDDFKTALDRLRAFKISRIGSFAVEGSAAERSWRNGLSDHHHPWAMESLSSKDNEKFVKTPAGPQRGESSTSSRPLNLSPWKNAKPFVSHIEQSGNLPKDQDEVHNVSGFANKKDVMQPERSWLKDSNTLRRANGNGKSAKDNAVDSDSTRTNDVEIGAAI